MLQRIQTLFLLAALLLNIIFMFVPLTLDTPIKRTFGEHTFMLILGVVTSASLIYTIFLFGNRKRQMLLCKLVGLAAFSEFVIALFGVALKSHTSISIGNWGITLPLIALLMIYLAYRAIYRDEQLVRSADRLR